MRWRREVSVWWLEWLLVIAAFCGGCAPPPSPEPMSVDFIEARRFIDAGTVHLRSGEFDQAAAAFDVAFQMAALPEALDGLGCVAFMRGELEIAARFFRAAYERDPTYGQALGNLALVLESSGDAGGAAASYKRALELDPRNFRARTNHAAFIARQNGSTVLPGTDAQRELLRARVVHPHPLIEWNLRGGLESSQIQNVEEAR
jgi:Flp pilus assembly protein TadD